MFHLIKSKDGSLSAGDVIRVFDGAFGDAIILGFSESDDVKVSRPYAYASSVGTTGPVVLTGAETYSLPFKSVIRLPKVGDKRVA